MVMANKSDKKTKTVAEPIEAVTDTIEIIAEGTEDSGISMPRINMLRQAPTPEALQLVPENLAFKYKVVPLAVENNTLRVAMVNPDNVLTIEALAARTKKRIEAVPAEEGDIQEAIDFNYKAFGDISKQFGMVAKPQDSVAPEVLAVEAADDSPIAQALMMIAEEAVKARASDIHIEPEENKLRVRFRIDGTLHDVISLPPGAQGPLISRIKILANMNIADRLRPQDGQCSMDVKGKAIDIRVATINTVHGEMAVLRILDKSMGAMSLSLLGLLAESQEKFEKMLVSPYGMVLISGPTGAGKTTTLYAATNSLDRVKRNIITIEDPVEYRFEGMNQIQVNPRAGVTFASGLRAIVRLDPDVILVGEIRDQETAEIAVQSALTGHLVLSSVHANDTAGVLLRLTDLNVEPFLISSGVIGIVAQRMVRRVCPYCSRTLAAPLVERIAYERVMGEEKTEFSYGEGCKACVYTGYLGRTGIFEILMMTDEIRELLVRRASASEIRYQAVKEGLISITKDGMLKVKAGITTPYEVMRNAPME